MSSTSIDTPTSPTTTMLDANEHHPYNQQQHQHNYQQQQQQQQQRHYHQYTTKAIVASAGANTNCIPQQHHQYPQQNPQNIKPLSRQMNKESSLTPSSSNSSSVSINVSQGCSTAAAVHSYNHNPANGSKSSSQYQQQIHSHNPNHQQQQQYQSQSSQQYHHNVARASASYPNTSNVYSSNNSGTNGADISANISLPSTMQQAHPHAPNSLNNININGGCGNNLANHYHQQQQHHQQMQHHHQQMQHQHQQNVQHQHQQHRHPHHNTVDVCCIGFGNSSHVERVAAEVSYCSSSTSSCCSSAASVAGVAGLNSSGNAVNLNAVVGPVTPVIQQKLSRTIPSDKINLRLILVSGKTKEFLFNPTDSAGDIAQTVFDNWPEDWEREAVSKAEILRLIYQGRFLHCNVTLGALGLPLGKTTVMHLVPRDNLPEPNSQDQRQKSKGGSSRCCSTTCCIL